MDSLSVREWCLCYNLCKKAIPPGLCSTSFTKCELLIFVLYLPTIIQRRLLSTKVVLFLTVKAVLRNLEGFTQLEQRETTKLYPVTQQNLILLFQVTL